MTITHRNADDTVGELHCSVATVTLDGRPHPTLARKLAVAAAAGFGAVEVCHADMETCGLEPAEVAKIAADNGLQVALWQPLRDAEGVPDVQFPIALEHARRAFETTAGLGAHTLIACSNVSPAAVSDFGLIVDQLGRIADLGSTWDVQVAYEPLSWGTSVHSYQHGWAIVKAVGHDNLGMGLDSFHILARGESLAGIAQIPAGKILAVQVADAPRMELDYRSWSRQYRCCPGEGDLPVAAFIEAVLDTGWDGWLGLELFSARLREQDPMLTGTQGMASLAQLAGRLQPHGRQRRPAVQHA